MPYLEAASSMPCSLLYMNLEESKYLPKDANFFQLPVSTQLSDGFLFLVFKELQKDQRSAHQEEETRSTQSENKENRGESTSH